MFALFLSHGVYAQIWEPCVDSNRVSQFYPCGPVFDPVCGCDQVTYTNECVAYNRAGVNRIDYSGVCFNKAFYFDFWPNPASDLINFHIQLSAEQTSPSGSLQLMDVYGNTVYFRLLTNLRSDIPHIETLSLFGLETGVFFLLVRVGNTSEVKKLVKFRV